MKRSIRKDYLLLFAAIFLLFLIPLQEVKNATTTYMNNAVLKKKSSSLPRVIIQKNYTFVDEKVKDAKIKIYGNGIRIVEPVNMNTKKQVLSFDDVYKMYNSLNPRIKPFITEIQLVDYRDPDAPNTNMDYTNTLAATEETEGKIIFYYNDYQLKENGKSGFYKLINGTMKHEAAHAWDWHLGNEKYEYSDQKEWKDARQKDGNYVSGYAKEAAIYEGTYAEDFADAVEKYLGSVKNFRNNYPNRAKILDRLLSSIFLFLFLDCYIPELFLVEVCLQTFQRKAPDFLLLLSTQPNQHLAADA
jgi:hypothetical protein